MQEFDLEKADKKFYVGKRQLDSGGFTAAIKIYDELIAENQQFEDIPEARPLLENALNNRGVAKCKSGLRYNDEAMYRDGMKDLTDSIAMEGEISETDKQWLTAQHNLYYAEEEVKTFKDNITAEQSNFFKFITN